MWPCGCRYECDFEAVYDNISIGTASGNAYLTLDGVKQQVTFDGEVILPFVIDETWPLEYQTNSEDGSMTCLHPYLVEVMVDYDCRGVMDSRTGKMIVPAIYSDIKMISKDLLMAEVDGNEENNIILTTSGEIVEMP